MRIKYFNHQNIYYWSLVGLAISLPLSIFMTSLFEIILVANWMFEGYFQKKIRIIKERKSLLIILTVYLVHILGLIYTRDFQYALHDLKIKLPLLVLPLVFGTSQVISYKQLKLILLFFSGAVIIGSVVSVSVLFGLVNYTYQDFREISIFIDHIRFSLMINIAIFSLLYYAFIDVKSIRKIEIFAYSISVIWLIFFLILLQSITGIIVFFITGFILFWLYVGKIKHLVLRWFLSVVVITIPLLVFSFITSSISRFYSVEKVNEATIDQYTLSGNQYFHDFSKKILENGHYIWLYICEPEMKQEWNKISRIDYNDHDGRGHEIKYTLVRYLTSRGYRKDSVGISRLTVKDIELIEKGIANYLYGEKVGIYPRLYGVIWQVDVFLKGANPSGHSVTQRILYLQTALEIFKKNPVLGVGTGDLATAFKDQYADSDSPLMERWRLRAHNQYMTFLVTFGVVGFIWIFIALLYPVFIENKWKSYFFIMFFMIGFLSMLNEDTLETHIGVSFFSFFYSLFLLGTGKDI